VFRLSPAGLLALQSLLRPVPEEGGGNGGHGSRDALIGAAGVAASILLGGKNKRNVQSQGQKQPSKSPPPPGSPNGRQ